MKLVPKKEIYLNSVRLSDCWGTRNNNFNLIRIVAAMMVLVSHSYALTGHTQPFLATIGMSPGNIAVDIFFVTSGFLITSSLLRRNNALYFIWGRVLRIYPAILVNVILMVFVLGPFFTVLPLSSYFESKATYAYLAQCTTLVHVVFNLPGVFEHLPYSAVNGSLWTLPYELRMYSILFCLWLAARAVRKMNSNTDVPRCFTLFVAGWTVASCIVIFMPLRLNRIAELMHINPRLSFMFFIGASAFVFKEKIRLSPTAAWLCVAALSCAVAQKSLFNYVWMAVLAYLLLAAAFLPSGAVRKYNFLGDYSYGVYIYAWPVQEAIKTLRPEISIGGMIAISTSVTLALSILSWHLVEKRMLAKKARCIEWTRRIITRGVPMGDIG